MKQYLKILLLTLCGMVAAYTQADVRVIPVSYDAGRQGGSWVFLFTKGQNDKYFGTFFTKKGQGLQAAQGVLNAKTKRDLHGDWQNAIWVQHNGKVYCFVYVPFVPGKKLYRLGKRDFAWANRVDLRAGTVKKGADEITYGAKSVLDQYGKQVVLKFKKAGFNRRQAVRNRPIGIWSHPKGNYLYFYKRTDPYYEFANTCAKFPIKTAVVSRSRPWFPQGRKIKWASTEHYFQAHKAANPFAFYTNTLEKLQPGRQVQVAGQKAPGYDQNLWDAQGMKYAVMHVAVLDKFRQHPNLKKLLLGTGNAIIVEDAGQNDALWGAGANYNGDNHLGRILMWVRKELRTGQLQKYPSHLNAQQFMQAL
jgi:N-glycosidase YbiA